MSDELGSFPPVEYNILMSSAKAADFEGADEPAFVFGELSSSKKIHLRIQVRLEFLDVRVQPFLA